jgi:hypothetical protein
MSLGVGTFSTFPMTPHPLQVGGAPSYSSSRSVEQHSKQRRKKKVIISILIIIVIGKIQFHLNHCFILISF